MPPRITVLMSVYNAEANLRESIDSVLDQTFTDFEFLIVDDGSTDKSFDIVKSYDDERIAIIQNKTNIGLIDSLNKGIEKARGAYIARQDADDICHKDRLMQEVDVLDEDPSVVLVGTWLELINASGDPIGVWQYPTKYNHVKWFLLFNSAVAHPSAMYRTEVVRNVGGYSKDYMYGEDYELWSRLSKHGKIVNLPQKLQRYRIHPGAVSRRKRLDQQNVQLRIATENIREIDVNRSIEPYLRIILGFDNPGKSSDILKAYEKLNELYKEFSDQNSLDQADQNLILSDIKDRMVGKLSKLSVSNKILCLIRRPGIVPRRYWATGKIFSILINEKFKKRVKYLMGKAD